MESSHLSSILDRYFEKGRDEGNEEVRFLGIGIGVVLGRKKGREEGRKEGREEGAISFARWMLNRDMSVDDIKDATGLSMEKINSLKGK